MADMVGGSATLVPPPQLMAYVKLEVLHHWLDSRHKILCWIFYLTPEWLCVAAYRYVTSSGSNERVVQSTVYPGMRMWRRKTKAEIQQI
ncbi:GL23011 [Drosophila persimilis]|uniref:GL23011 n=1 Tax=Drosophila persimilis TaxID=7234 RepID=B4HDP0_DROPE|nr:GL23011 [Drosophila persimilis]